MLKLSYFFNIRHDDSTTYSPEELLGMILTHAKHIAEDYTEQKPLRDIVLTVPAFFNQAERRALKGAVELAGLNLLQLITEPMAVSLNYGMFRRKEINGTAKHLMFYDMGAYDTTVSIVGYTVVQTKERGFSEKHPQAQILGLGYDRSLGGLELQIKLREHLATKFNELKKPKTGKGFN
jgi:hypoxia up-regulated 1